MNKKGQLTIWKLFSSLVILSMVSVGIVSFMSSMVSNYEKHGAIPLTNNETDTYNKFNILEDLDNMSKELDTSVRNPQGLDKLTDSSFFILKPSAIWSSIKVILKMPIFILNIVEVSILELGIPYWVWIGAQSLIVMAVVLLLLSAIMKWRFI